VTNIGFYVGSIFIVLVAGYIRGYSGFGSGMFAVLGLSLLFSPSQIIPVILILEVVASGYLLPSVWRIIDWSSLGWLFFGAALGAPLGSYLLAIIPPKPMRATIAFIVIVLVVLFNKGLRIQYLFNKAGTVAIGLISGILNGGAAIGGPPVILFFFSSPTQVAVSRASLIGFFFGTDFYAVIMCATQGLIGLNTFKLAGILLPSLLIGLAIGKSSFVRTDPGVFRRRVLQLLLALSLAALFRAIVWP